MTFLDMFSGIGGFRRGFELAGHTCVGHIEIDKYADRSYRAIHDVKEDEFYWTDISLLESNHVPDCDIWCFGFPCQDISSAGNRIGLAGRRSGLYYAVIDLLKGKPEAVRPKWLVAENVRNLLYVNNGWDFHNVCAEMAAAGYAVQWAVHDTADYGLPQTRERIFIIGSSIRHFGREPPAEILPVRRESKPTIRRLTGESMWNRVYHAMGLTPTLKTSPNGYFFIPILEVDKPHTRARSRFRNHDTMYTLLASQRHGILWDGAIRALTPLEYWRLQGFRDADFHKAAAVCSERQLYKQAGNSVSVPVVHTIAKSLLE